MFFACISDQAGGTASMPDTFAYCLANGLLGVGWRVDALETTKSWDEFYAEASAVHEDLNTLSVHKQMGQRRMPFVDPRSSGQLLPGKGAVWLGIFHNGGGRARKTST